MSVEGYGKGKSEVKESDDKSEVKESDDKIKNNESKKDSWIIDINNENDVDTYVSNLMNDDPYWASKVAEHFSEINFKNSDEMLLKVWEKLSISDSISKKYLTDCFVKKITDNNWNNKDCIFKFIDKALSESYWYTRYTCLKNIGNICDKLDNSSESKNVIKNLAEDAFKQNLNPFSSKIIVDNFDKIISKVYDDDFTNKIVKFVLKDDYDYNKSELIKKLDNVNPEIKDKVINIIDSENPDILLNNIDD